MPLRGTADGPDATGTALDDRACSAYVRRVVNLLLLLSAILSALNSASGARVAQPVVQVARVAQAAVSARVAVAQPTRPAAALPELRKVAAFGFADDRPAPAKPLFLSRRRE